MGYFVVKHYRQSVRGGTCFQFKIGECQVKAGGPRRALAVARDILAPKDDGTEYLVVKREPLKPKLVLAETTPDLLTVASD